MEIEVTHRYKVEVSGDVFPDMETVVNDCVYHNFGTGASAIANSTIKVLDVELVSVEILGE